MAVAGEGFAQLRVRVASAVVFGAIVLAVVLFGGPVGLGVGLGVAAALAGGELCRMLPGITRQSALLGGVGAAVIPLAAAAGTLRADAIGGVLVAIGALAAVFVVVVVWLAISLESSSEGAAAAALATGWVGLGLAHLVFLRGVPGSGEQLTLLVVLGVWTGDVAAYLVGAYAGRHKLAPRLSPGKSWEGFAAGTVATVATWLGGGFLLHVPMPSAFLALTGVLVAVAGLTGDLAESRIKRLAGVKDSGTMIPGHGGVFDRFDSLIAVSFVAFWASAVGGLL